MLLSTSHRLLKLLCLLPAIQCPFRLTLVALYQLLLGLLHTWVVGHILLLVVLVDFRSECVEFLTQNVGVLTLRSALVLGFTSEVFLLDGFFDFGSDFGFFLA